MIGPPYDPEWLEEGHSTHYRCTKCPNLILKADERSTHRAYHRSLRMERETRAAEKARQEKEAMVRAAKKRPGSASRTTRAMAAKQSRYSSTPSTVQSSDSMFEKMSRIEQAEDAGRPTLYTRGQLSHIRKLVNTAEEDDDPDSEGNRRHRAIRQHIMSAPVFKTQYPGA